MLKAIYKLFIRSGTYQPWAPWAILVTWGLVGAGLRATLADAVLLPVVLATAATGAPGWFTYRSEFS